MRRLRGADGYHLYKETRRQHLHTIKVQILEPQPSEEPFDFDAFKRAFEAGVSEIPPFHWQLVRVPVPLAHPLWRYQRELDIDYHVRRIAAPSPGGNRELDEVISEIASTGLERDRPLWQLWRVEGLAHGRIAYVTKLHHSVADGVSSAQILIDSFQPHPEPDPERPGHEWPEGEPVPPDSELLLGEFRYVAGRLAAFPKLLLRTLRSWGISLRRMREGKPRMGAPFSAPRTRFNQPLTPHRWFANVDVPLGDMKRVKDVLGGTLNDVFVAIASGAIRRYLDERGELPATTLTGTIPVSIREAQEIRTYGNRLGSWLIHLATEVADPVERYAAIRRNTAAARESFEAKDRKLISDWQEYWWIFRLMESLQRLLSRLSGRPGIHVIISNVRGPSSRIYSNGVPVVALRSMGPLVDDCGLNFTGWSYMDTMSIGIVACREHVPDIREIAAAARSTLDELVEAAEKVAQQGRG